MPTYWLDQISPVQFLCIYIPKVIQYLYVGAQADGAIVPRHHGNVKKCISSALTSVTSVWTLARLLRVKQRELSDYSVSEIVGIFNISSSLMLFVYQECLMIHITAQCGGPSGWLHVLNHWESQKLSTVEPGHCINGGLLENNDHCKQSSVWILNI